MSYSKNLNFKPILLLIAGCLTTPTAFATVSFAGSSNLNYTVNSISGSNINNLVISGSFQQLTDSADYYVTATGDATDVANDPAITSAALTGNSFNNTYLVTGNSFVNGSGLNAQNTGLLSLNFTNNSASSFNIVVSLNYSLNAVADGLYVNNYVNLNYWDTANNISGFDFVGAGTYDGFAYDNETQTGSALLTFTLAANSTDSFIAETIIDPVFFN